MQREYWVVPEARCCPRYDLVSNKRPLLRDTAIRLFSVLYHEPASNKETRIMKPELKRREMHTPEAFCELH